MGSAREESDELGRLLSDARAGDATARERLIEEHLPGLRAYVRLNMSPALRAMESCSDVVQSVCRDLIDGLDQLEYRGAASFRHWLYRAALNKIVDHHRYWHAERRHPGKEVALDGTTADASRSRGLLDGYATITTPSRIAEELEEVARVEAAFDRLPEHYREVIVLSRIVGLPHREIAGQLGRTEVATRTLLRRALVHLAGLLDEAGPEG